MFKMTAACCLRSLARPASGNSSGPSANGQLPMAVNPTIQSVPRPIEKIFLQQRRNHFSNAPHRKHFSRKMAATKDYRLVCLENPLLGMFPAMVLPCQSVSLAHGWAILPRHSVIGERYVTDTYTQTFKPLAMRLCSRSTASRRTTRSWPRRSIWVSTRTCSTTMTPS